MFKSSLACVAVLTFAIIPLGAKDQATGFDGKWSLDKHAQNVGDPPPPADLKQQIKTQGAQIVVQSQFAEPPSAVAPLLYLGIMTSQMNLSTDGQESQNQVGPYMLVSKTTVNGNTMQTDWKTVFKGDPVEGHWTRTLSDDGKHMTLQIKESSIKGQAGEATLHFARK